MMKAYAPASIGNFAAGFDVLGVAIEPIDGSLWGDIVEVRQAKAGLSLEVVGPFAAAVPQSLDENLVGQVARLYLNTAPVKQSGGLHLVLNKGLPICSGLGSSAASVVATLAALNGYFGQVDPTAALPSEALLTLAGQGEALVSGAAHLDNVAPSLLGGICLVDQRGGVRLLPHAPHWRLVVVHSDQRVSTHAAREALPKQIPLSDAVTYWQNLSSLIANLYEGDWDLAAQCVVDSLIEGPRAPLVQGFEQVKEAALAAGALGASLSGSGPSIFALCPDEAVAQSVLEAMLAPFTTLGLETQAHICKIATRGARQL